MMANIEREDICVMYFEELMRKLLKEYGITTLIDDVWVVGIEQRQLFARLDDQYQAAIVGLDTLAAKCYMNGIRGRDWNEDLWYEI